MTNSLARQDRTSCQNLTMTPSNSASSFCGKIQNTPLNASVCLQTRSKYVFIGKSIFQNRSFAFHSSISSNLHRPSSLILSNELIIHSKKQLKIPKKQSQTISTFQYIPACESLAYKKARSATVSHQ